MNESIDQSIVRTLKWVFTDQSSTPWKEEKRADLIEVNIDGQTFCQFSMRISTIILQNLMSTSAATVSSRGRNSVGPKHTPKFETVIKFRAEFPAILKDGAKTWTWMSLDGKS